MSIRGRVAIVGAAESEQLGRIPDKSALQLHAESGLAALRDAGLTVADVDGVACAGESPLDVANYLGINPSYLDGTMVGGTSFMLHVRHAAAAIMAGLCETVLITHGESGRSRVGMQPWAPAPQSMRGQFEVPYGGVFAPSTFPIGVLRYMKQYGMTPEQLATVPVVQRKWAALNPRAKLRDEITVDDVLSSKMISYPLHLLECCLVTDGGAAVVVTSAQRAADRPKPPVYLLGAGEAGESSAISQMADLTSSRAFRDAGRAAFAEAGVSHSEVDHLMIYDAFAHVPLYGLEDLGFVGRGESFGFVEEGHTAPGGRLPMNTNGGGLAYTHTGMYGMFAICESVRQVRGEAAAQVDGVRTSVVLGNGGSFMSAGVLVLGAEEVAAA
ncbi:thiolase C-terminal domain-containing protein [Streptosporangium amethystogenes]|uniref:thiolase C-terminal domain-containing protein n=1 Tax=Streptosporangium amethystogenes TaxID=2002 RepID=UPI00378A9070